MTAAASEPIVAAATPRGAASRAVLRLSGQSLLSELAARLPAGIPCPPLERGSYPLQLMWAHEQRVSVQALVFPGPHSATGEDVLELHLPGSQPVVDALLARFHAAGFRAAEPGEFTRRAFLNGRLDLTQAEAVLALVSAGTQAEARAAAGMLTGALSACMQRTRDALHEALTELEAGLDFEEGDSQDLEPGEVGEVLDRAERALREGIDVDARSRAEDRSTRTVGLIGPPNAGKTALVRRLTGDEGLVSDREGTTRDWRTSTWTPEGEERPLQLVDGPGFGGLAVDPRDRDAQAQARAAAPEVDLWWCCADPAAAHDRPPLIQEAPCLLVWTKADLGASVPTEAGEEAAVRVSSETGAGLQDLAEQTLAILSQGESERAAVLAGSERHQAALTEALGHLQTARSQVAAGGLDDLVAEELRLALNALAALVGAWTPEDLLDRLFAQFCVGK